MHKVSTIKKKWEALTFWYRCWGVMVPYEMHDMVEEQIKALAHRAEWLCESIRGVLTPEMVEQLMQVLVEAGAHQDIINGWLLARLFGLRPGQIARLTRNQFVYVPNAEGGPRVEISLQSRKVGAPRKQGNKLMVEHHSSPAGEATERMKALLIDAPGNKRAPVAPTYTATRLNPYVKQAAARFDWPKNVKWDPHAVGKHSCAAEAYEHGGAAEVMRQTGHKSLESVYRYGEPAWSRIARADAMAEAKRQATKLVRTVATPATSAADASAPGGSSLAVRWKATLEQAQRLREQHKKATVAPRAPWQHAKKRGRV